MIYNSLIFKLTMCKFIDLYILFIFNLFLIYFCNIFILLDLSNFVRKTHCIYLKFISDYVGIYLVTIKSYIFKVQLNILHTNHKNKYDILLVCKKKKKKCFKKLINRHIATLKRESFEVLKHRKKIKQKRNMKT